jgi:alkylation response protein AidB-like acyl-CoA dehydrogenase
MFAVDANAAGVRHQPVPTLASDKQNAVTFEDVRVPAANILGAEGGAWPVFKKIANKATVIECAYLVGLSQMAFDITLNYTKERVQFGRPIASFQAIQHKAADVVTDVDGSRYVTYDAAWAVSEDEPDADEKVHVAKAWTSEASRRVVGQCQQMHGGIGFTKDYKIQLYYRRQKASELAWGDADYHRDRLGALLGV